MFPCPHVGALVHRNDKTPITLEHFLECLGFSFYRVLRGSLPDVFARDTTLGHWEPASSFQPNTHSESRTN